MQGSPYRLLTIASLLRAVFLGPLYLAHLLFRRTAWRLANQALSTARGGNRKDELLLPEAAIERIADRVMAKLDERERAKEQSATNARTGRLKTKLELLSSPEQVTEVWRLRETLSA